MPTVRSLLAHIDVVQTVRAAELALPGTARLLMMTTSTTTNGVMKMLMMLLLRALVCLIISRARPAHLRLHSTAIGSGKGRIHTASEPPQLTLTTPTVQPAMMRPGMTTMLTVMMMMMVMVVMMMVVMVVMMIVIAITVQLVLLQHHVGRARLVLRVRRQQAVQAADRTTQIAVRHGQRALVDVDQRQTGVRVAPLEQTLARTGQPYHGRGRELLLVLLVLLLVVLLLLLLRVVLMTVARPKRTGHARVERIVAAEAVQPEGGPGATARPDPGAEIQREARVGAAPLQEILLASVSVRAVAVIVVVVVVHGTAGGCGAIAGRRRTRHWLLWRRLMALDAHRWLYRVLVRGLVELRVRLYLVQVLVRPAVQAGTAGGGQIDTAPTAVVHVQIQREAVVGAPSLQYARPPASRYGGFGTVVLLAALLGRRLGLGLGRCRSTFPAAAAHRFQPER